jgi:hypothetical protein
MSSNARLIPLCRFALFLVVSFLFITRLQGTVHAMLPLCSDVCGPGANCNMTCFDDITNTYSQCGLYNGGEPANECGPGYCGDGYCNSATENVMNCAQDCFICGTSKSVCGDHVCCPDEVGNCNQDCASPVGPNPPPSCDPNTQSCNPTAFTWCTSDNYSQCPSNCIILNQPCDPAGAPCYGFCV